MKIPLPAEPAAIPSVTQTQAHRVRRPLRQHITMNERATMRICIRYVFAFTLLPLLLGPAAEAAEPPAASPVGEWLVHDGSARIRIVPCGNSLWGSISWAEHPGTDENNPDPAKRSRSVIGMPILLNMKKTEPNRWEGEVYNAENGKTYTSNISLVEDDVLRIEGCVFGGLFCGGEDWTRVPPSKDEADSAASTKEVCPHAKSAMLFSGINIAP